MRALYSAGENFHCAASAARYVAGIKRDAGGAEGQERRNARGSQSQLWCCVDLRMISPTMASQPWVTIRAGYQRAGKPSKRDSLVVTIRHVPNRNVINGIITYWEERQAESELFIGFYLGDARR